MESLVNELRQIYIEKINTVQDYIEKHLDEEINVQQLSKIASFSEYHFQSIEGGLHLTVTTPYKNEIRQLVLNHPEHVTALKPDEFIQEIKELSQAISKKYSKP